MIQNFDEIIAREKTNCYKYDLREKFFNAEDVFPMWVADTDFKAPDFIIEAMQKRLSHGIFGYTFLDDDYYRAITQWLKKQHGWNVEKDWIKYSPGVVPSLFACVLAFTQPDDKVIVQTPVYFPFYSAVKETGRTLVRNPLVLKDGRYYMDLEDLKSKIDDKTKMIILCSPHNPTGNVWKPEELIDLCNICLEKNILIISDEIHADIVFDGFKHTPTASLSDDIARNTMTLMAPSKTFNIAGLNSSYVVSSNSELVEKFAKQIEALHIGPNIFAIEATKAAYFNGELWLKELIGYFKANTNTVKEFLKQELDKVSFIEPEGTYLLWLDFRKFGLKREEINKILIEGAKLGLSDGFMFGEEGDGFQRMNIGCPNSMIKKALSQLLECFRNL